MCVCEDRGVRVSRLSKGEAVEHKNAKCTHGDAPACTKTSPRGRSFLLDLNYRHTTEHISETYSTVQCSQNQN